MKKPKKILLIHRRAPHGTNYAQEGLEVALIAGAFEQRVSVAFVDDGVFQLKRGQDAAAIGMKNFTKTFGALGDFDVRAVYVERESLNARGLRESDLVQLCAGDGDNKNMVQVIAAAELAAILAAHDVLLNF